MNIGGALIPVCISKGSESKDQKSKDRKSKDRKSKDQKLEDQKSKDRNEFVFFDRTLQNDAEPLKSHK